jgi:hypothetical protein
MEAHSQFHTPATLSLEKELQVPIVLETGLDATALAGDWSPIPWSSSLQPVCYADWVIQLPSENALQIDSAYMYVGRVCVWSGARVSIPWQPVGRRGEKMRPEFTAFCVCVCGGWGTSKSSSRGLFTVVVNETSH